MRRLVVVAVLVTVSLSLGARIHRTAAQLTANPTMVESTGGFTVKGSGFNADASVDVCIDSACWTANPGSGGDFLLVMSAPDAPGTHLVTAVQLTGRRGNRVIKAETKIYVMDR